MSDGVVSSAGTSQQNRTNANPPTPQSRSESGGTSRDRTSRESTALARVAIDLTEPEKEALAAALERRYGHAVHLEVEVDRKILGGVWVRLDDTIIDGSLQGRIEALRHHLRASNRAMGLHQEQPRDPEGGKP